MATVFAGDRNVRLPGPSPVPDRIVRAISQPIIGHRSDVFRKIFRSVVANLKELFETEGDVYIFSGSGTLAMESAVANLLAPGDTCVVGTCGKFGERWIEIAEAFGARPVAVTSPPGTGVSAEAVAQALDAHPDARVLFTTQNESSTAVINDVAALAEVARARDVLIVVDAVSSLGGAPLSMDAWGVDVVVSGSQKCLMLPPGLAFVAVSPRARDRVKADGCRYYADWRRYAKSFEGGETPYTPAVSLIFGLEEALKILEEEGRNARHQRHVLMRDMVRAGAVALGLTPFVDQPVASPTVTAVTSSSIDLEALRKIVRAETGVVLSGGQGELKGKIVRIGHMGAATPMDMVATLAALELGLSRMGVEVAPGAGTEAAMKVWRQCL